MDDGADHVLPPHQDHGEYAPAGEGEGTTSTFSAAQIAAAFGVDQDRVERAIASEFGSEVGTISSPQAQQLAEALLVDRPLPEREAALMTLGAFVPRVDHISGLGEKDSADESDRLVPNSDQADGERGPTEQPA